MKTKIKIAKTALLAALLAVMSVLGTTLPASASVAPDVSWYTDDPTATEFYIDDAADALGLWVLMSDKIGDYVPGETSPLHFAFRTITLRNDLDLAAVSRDWIPLGKYDPYASSSTTLGGGVLGGATPFNGTFNGGGHTIIYSSEETTDNWRYGDVGFFFTSAI
jgi:hypothetical protein